MSRVLLDSDILIDFLRERQIAKEILFRISMEHEALCSVITIGEIIAGMHRSEKEKTYQLFHGLEIIPINFDIAEQAGEWKNNYQSHTLKLDDCLIAATCFKYADYLCTRNKKHYPMPEIAFF